MKNIAFPRRLMITVYDLIILLGIIFIFSLPFADIKINENTSFIFLFQLYMYIVIKIFYVYLWTNGRSTIGMKAWKTKVVNIYNDPIKYKTAIIRFNIAFVTNIFFCIGILYSVYDKENRTIYDIISKTNLVKI